MPVVVVVAVVAVVSSSRPLCFLKAFAQLQSEEERSVAAGACSAAALALDQVGLVLCSSSQESRHSSLIVGVLCSSARGGHLRAERGQPVCNNQSPPLVQPFRIEVFEEQLVRDAHVVERAFAVIPVLR